MTESQQRLVILGASGDLTKRLLLPGLGMLLANDGARHVEVWGAGRDALEPTEWGARVGNALVRGGCDDDRALAVVAASRYVQIDITEREGVESLLAQGIDDFDWDRCWREYRRGSFANLVMTVAPSMLVERTERGDQMFLASLRRGVAQIRDLDAVDLLP